MKAPFVITVAVTAILLAVTVSAFSITSTDYEEGLKHFLLLFDDFFQDRVTNNNISTTQFWNGKVLCENVVGGSDADHCTDDGGVGGGGDIKSGAAPFLYNDTDTIYFNDTYGNDTYIRQGFETDPQWFLNYSSNVSSTNDLVTYNSVIWLNTSSGLCIKGDISGSNITITTDC